MLKLIVTLKDYVKTSSVGITQLVWCSVVLTISIVWSAIYIEYRSDRKVVSSVLDQAAAADARGYAQYVMLNLSILDRLLISLRDEHQQKSALPLQATLDAQLKPIVGLLLQVAVTDANGTVIDSTLEMSSTSVSIADRPHFLALKGKTIDQLFISGPVLGRVSNKVSLQLVRPRISPDGRFLGVIVASMDPEFLKDYFKSTTIAAPDSRLSIIGNDGIVRFRLTLNGFTAGQDVKPLPSWPIITSAESGFFNDKSPMDGISRRSAFDHVDGFPLIVSLGRGLNETVLNNQERWMQINAISFALSLVLLMVGFAVSRLVKTQQHLYQLAQANQQRAIENDRSKSMFLASVSHELRTPLNSILGFSELLRDSCVEPRNKQFAGLINKSGKHLHALVNTLLDLAKIESGKMGLEVEPINIQTLLETLVSIHKVTADQRNIELSLSIDEKIDGELKSDRTKLVQVFNNVFHNAIKFTESGCVFVVAKPAGASGVLVSVIDTGIGVSAEELKHVFKRFNSVNSHASGNSEKGTGLGLALCRELLTLMGGTINMISEQGYGTTVDIFIPYSVNQVKALS